MFWNKKEKVECSKGPALSCIHNGLCSKEKCPLWVVFDTQDSKGIWNNRPEGKCTFAWMPTLLVEMRNGVITALKK